MNAILPPLKRLTSVRQNAGVSPIFFYKIHESADEIVAKLLSLKGVLEPSYSNDIIKVLKSSGFRYVERIFKLNSFEGFLAVK